MDTNKGYERLKHLTKMTGLTPRTVSQVVKGPLLL